MMQVVVRMSINVQMDGVSQLGGCVTETTTVATMPMNRTVLDVPPPPPPQPQYHQVYYVVIVNAVFDLFACIPVQNIGRNRPTSHKMRGSCTL